MSNPRPYLALLGGLLLSTLAPSALDAQGWAVEAATGRTSPDPLRASSETHNSLSLALTHQGDHWAYLQAGAPIASSATPWAAAGLGSSLWHRVGPVLSGIALAGHGFAYPAERQADVLLRGGVTLEAYPTVSLSHGPATLDLRSGPQAFLQSHTQANPRMIHASDAALTLHANAGSAALDLRYLRAAEASYPYAGARVNLTLRGVTTHAHWGRWLSDSIPTPTWSLGIEAPVGRATFQASLVQETRDPLYWNEPRRTWNLGIRLPLARTTPQATPILVRAAHAPVELRVPRTANETPPLIAGDFSQWEPVSMKADGNTWVVTLTLPSGSYRYAFRSPDGTWFVPEGTPGRTDDGFGGYSALLIIP